MSIILVFYKSYCHPREGGDPGTSGQKLRGSELLKFKTYWHIKLIALATLFFLEFITSGTWIPAFAGMTQLG
jgi:hypothetical protein